MDKMPHAEKNVDNFLLIFIWNCLHPPYCNFPVYVDSSADCNDLTFQLGQMAVGTGLAQRQWSIKVSVTYCTVLGTKK